MTTIDREPSAIDKLVHAVKGRERWIVAGAVFLQLAVLTFMTVKGTMKLVRGDVYYVRVEPVDPRDLFRGDYVILSYEFSRLPPEFRADWERNHRGLDDPDRELRGRPIYVSLEKEGDGKHWRARRFSLDQPGKGPFLRGTLNERGRLTFGIEQFFVQEGKGRAYEEAVRSRRLSAEIAITPEGDAAMRGLHIDEK